MAVKKAYKPGDTGPEILKWDEYFDIPFVIRKKPVKRVSPPKTSFPENGDEMISGIREKMTEVSKNIVVMQQGKKRREAHFKDLKKSLASLEKKRKPLTRWEDEQIRRCLEGHGTMTGLHYFYFNFGWIQEISEGGSVLNIKPTYRSCDDWAFRMAERATEECTGICLAKRRRWGWSWMLTCIIVYDIVFRDADILFITKDQDDRDKFYSRIRYFHDNLPRFLRKEWDRNAIEIKQWKPSERIAKVRGVDVEDVPMAVLQTASSKNAATAAGGTRSKIIIDEAGEIPNLRKVLQWGIPALAGSNGIDRAGALIIGGTVGDMDTSGHVMKKVFDSPRSFEVMSVFVPGWMGTYMDDYGNDRKEYSKAKITARIDQFKADGLIEESITERQKFPMTLDDAWLRNTEGKLWPVLQITQAQARMDKKKYPWTYGRFVEDSDGVVSFVTEIPNKAEDKDKKYPGSRQWVMLEPYLKSLSDWKDPYVIGSDPVDLDSDKYGQKLGKSRYILSDFASVVYKRAQNIGGQSNLPVAYYFGREDDVEEMYEQTALAARYYQDSKINIERNKGTRFHSWLISNGYGDLIATATGIALQIDLNKNAWGFHATEKWKQHMLGQGYTWWKKNWNKPVHQRFIDESMDIEERNTDLAIAFLAALQISLELDSREKRGRKSKKAEVKSTSKSLWVRRNGVMVPVHSDSDRMTASRDLYNKTGYANRKRN